MKIYDLVHFYDNGEHYEDKVDYEDHYLYSTLERAAAVYDQKTQDPKSIGSWSVFERELDDDCHTGTCMLYSEYIPCPSMYQEELYKEYEERMKEEAELQEYYDSIEQGFREAAGMTYFGADDWDPEWDNYCANREKQIIRIAHELADKHERLSIFDWINLVYSFYDMYELNSDERCLFTQEYYSQHFFRYGYV